MHATIITCTNQILRAIPLPAKACWYLGAGYISYKYGGSTQQGRGDYVETVFGSNGQQIGVRGEPVWLHSCRTPCLSNSGLELTIRMIRCMHIADMAV